MISNLTSHIILILKSEFRVCVAEVDAGGGGDGRGLGASYTTLFVKMQDFIFRH